MPLSPEAETASIPAHSGILLISGSKTREKHVSYDGIAHASRKEIGHVAVIALDVLKPHHAIEETGKSSVENARLKRVDLTFLHEPENRKQLNTVLKKRNLLHIPDHNIIGLGEDSILGFPEAIYEIARPHIARRVNPGLVENIECVRENNTNFVVLVEFGPIKDAMGAGNFFDLIRYAASHAKARYKEPFYAEGRVPLLDQASYSVTRLSDPPGAPLHESITTRTISYLHAPQGLDRSYELKHVGMHHSSRFMAAPSNPNTALVDRLDEHMVMESFRRQGLNKIVRFAVGNSTSVILPFKKVATETVRRKKRLRIVQITPGAINENSPKRRNMIGRHKVEDHTPSTLDQALKLIDLEFPFGFTKQGLPISGTADGFVVPARKIEDPQERLLHALAISSINVARQIDKRYFDTFVAINDLNNCHDETRKMAAAIANDGMSGDYPRLATHDKISPRKKIIDVPGVVLESSRYEDVIRGTNRSANARALIQLIEHRSLNYERTLYVAPPDFFGEENKSKPAGLFTMAALMSANNEGLQLGINMAAYGKFLADLGAGAVWGGMNKAPGEKFFKSYKAHGGVWLFASSTHDIVQLETREGRLPAEVDAFVLRQKMSSRVKDVVIEQPDALLVAKGGKGTLQELALGLLAKKPTIIFDPDLNGITEAPHLVSTLGYMIKYLLGAQKAEQIAKDHTALANQNVWLATTQDEAQQRTLEIRQEWANKIRHDRLVTPRREKPHTLYASSALSRLGT